MAIDTLAHGVLSDLLSATGNNMDITLLAPNMGSTESTQVFWRLESSHILSALLPRFLQDYLGKQPLPTQPLRCSHLCGGPTHGCMVTLLFGSGCFRSPLVSLDQMIER